PGWHIECSQMSMKYLGDSFDIHAGGEDLIFPHHENEIAQSEALTGKPFVNVWFHSRFLLVEGEKMAKSAGNFFTVRDLVLMGHKPSSIRFLLMSVPYRKQLNFTFDGLTQAANSVERLRNFKRRLETSQFPAGANPAIAELAEKASTEMRAAMEDDLNTARALGAAFDLVRDANAAADNGQVHKDDAPKLLKVLDQFDEIFAVLEDDDAAKVRTTVEWAKAEGNADKISPVAAELAKAASLSDVDVEKLVAEHSQARKTRDFARSDAIRNQLAENGVILENTKDGVRWKRK
ncbi:MAG TPA: DALR domain-containing protein, partial [Candidatus Limnocylindrales bacterium]|nr:DALR domain-containing protein [Candidatus Limnocylindrales bacterium]